MNQLFTNDLHLCLLAQIANVLPLFLSFLTVLRPLRQFDLTQNRHFFFKPVEIDLLVCENFANVLESALISMGLTPHEEHISGLESVCL